MASNAPLPDTAEAIGRRHKKRPCRYCRRPFENDREVFCGGCRYSDRFCRGCGLVLTRMVADCGLAFCNVCLLGQACASRGCGRPRSRPADLAVLYCPAHAAESPRCTGCQAELLEDAGVRGLRRCFWCLWRPAHRDATCLPLASPHLRLRCRTCGEKVSRKAEQDGDRECFRCLLRRAPGTPGGSAVALLHHARPPSQQPSEGSGGEGDTGDVGCGNHA